MVCWNCLKWKPTVYLPHEKHFMGVFSLRGMSVVGEKGHHQVQTHFPHGRVPSHQSICFTFGSTGRSPGFPAGSWITSMFTIEVIFFSSCFSSTDLVKISDKIFWKCHESQDGCPNGCQDPRFCGPKDRLCFGAQTQEHKPEPWSLQAITGYKTMLESRLQSALVTSKNTPSVGRAAKAKQTWGSYWHLWSWLWPWQCTAAVRKVRKAGIFLGNTVVS